MLDISFNIKSVEKELQPIILKVINEERINKQEGLLLFKKGSISLLGTLANTIREKKNGDITFFNKNIHIEPTNICIFDCKFCSYEN